MGSLSSSIFHVSFYLPIVIDGGANQLHSGGGGGLNPQQGPTGSGPSGAMPLTYWWDNSRKCHGQTIHTNLGMSPLLLYLIKGDADSSGGSSGGGSPEGQHDIRMSDAAAAAGGR